MIDNVEVSAFLDERCTAGRDVQLFSMLGQCLFPLYSGEGSLRSVAAMYPILRGRGEKAPKYEDKFPTKDGELLDLGDGWLLMCVTVGIHDNFASTRMKLDAAEEKLRAMKVPA